MEEEKSVIQISIKWGKEKLENIELNLNDSVEDF